MAPTTPVTLAQIIKRIEKRSTVSSADVKAVLDALQYEVIDALQNGNSVRLGELGSFRLSIKANGSDTSAEAKKVGANAIKAVNVQFTKSTAMKEALSPSSAEVSVSAMLVSMRQKNIAQVSILERYFFVSTYQAAGPDTCLAVFVVASLPLCL